MRPTGLWDVNDEERIYFREILTSWGVLLVVASASSRVPVVRGTSSGMPVTASAPETHNTVLVSSRNSRVSHNREKGSPHNRKYPQFYLH